MKLYHHQSYQEYLDAQIEKNIKKINLVWVKPEEILVMVKIIEELCTKPTRAICHGVRNGWEIQEFKKYIPGLKIIGTEISHTAKSFPDVIQWDFHDVKEKWLGKMDFIYSNSFDHSYKPEKCLDAWMSCIKKRNGICLIHWMKTNEEKIDAADCFAATLEEFRLLFNKKYKVVKEIGSDYRKIFVIKHKSKRKKK